MSHFSCFEDKLQKALHDLREVYDKQMESNKNELARMYDERVRQRNIFEGSHIKYFPPRR